MGIGVGRWEIYSGHVVVTLDMINSYGHPGAGGFPLYAAISRQAKQAITRPRSLPSSETQVVDSEATHTLW